jgi:hypothetical protein
MHQHLVGEWGPGFRRLALGLAVLTAVTVRTGAQREHGGLPASFRSSLRKPVPTARMRPVRADLLRAEDAASGWHEALRFGEALEVELGLQDAGVWEDLPGGGRVWRLRVLSPGAKSLAFVFRRYQLAEGCELHVYDDARAVVRGAFTEHENRRDGQFAVAPVRGEALTLEYYEPARARGLGELELASVTHDYLDVWSLIEDRNGSGGAGACQVDVACPEGLPFLDVIDSAVHVMSPVGILCSGSLLNNTADDGTILVLSAAHCTGLANATFTFRFQRPRCRGGVAPAINTITGATQLVLDTTLDVQLARLDVPQAPLPYRVYLAGWDRSDVAPPSSAIIHHPGGDAKKISLDDDPPGKLFNFWRIFDWETGVTQGGSSGAPMFDPSGRFIGNLDSGASSCQVPTNDDFATRLAAVWPLFEPYLDPIGSGQTALGGLDLALVSPHPFSVKGVFPPKVEALLPGPQRSVRVLGNGFDDATALELDGVPLDPQRFVRGGHSWFNVDLPQLDVGPHAFTVIRGAERGTAALEVVPALEPRYQVNGGARGEPIFSSLGIDTLHADLPGHLHYLFWSLSNVPSVNRFLSLGLGNGFTDLSRCRIGLVPANGWSTRHFDVPPGAFTFGVRIYSQTMCASHGLPRHVSNLQESEFQF